MAEEILAMAIFEAHDGHDEEMLDVLREAYAMLRSKGYSRDLLYRDTKNPHRVINLRYWTSIEARAQALEDPDVHRFWQHLGTMATMQIVFERLVEVKWDEGAGAG